MQEGFFLVFDGNDGSGKATQSRLLSERLSREGIPAEQIDFPKYDRNFFGAFIGECLAGQHGDFLNLDPKIASTLYACDRFESSSSIRAALAAGKVMIADRFTSANQIHQGGKITDEDIRASFLSWLDAMEHQILGIPRPQRIIYLKVPLEVSLKLLSEKRAAKNQMLGGNQKDMVEEDRQYLERSHATANWLLSHQPNWTVIDCMEGDRMRSPEEIHEEVWESLKASLPSAAVLST